MKSSKLALVSLAFATALASLSGCASLQSVSVTAVPEDRSKVVEADASNVAFLGIHFSNGFADELREDLKSKCPRGKVTGIYTKYESVWYFLVQKRKVSASGFCVEGDSAPAAPPTAEERDARADSRTTPEGDAS